MRKHGTPARWRQLEAFQRLSPQQMRQDIGQRLLAQLQHFSTLPHALPEWRELAKVNTVDALWEGWTTLPVIGKQELSTRFQPEELVSAGVHGHLSSSGGSTGEPTAFLHDDTQLEYGRAAQWYAWQQAGWRPGVPMIILWGSERDIGRQRNFRSQLGGVLRHTHLVDGYGLDQGTVDAVLRLVRGHRRVVITGFTSMLEFVAREVLTRGEQIPRGRVVAAWNGGEMLHQSQSDLFESAFGVPLLNNYGGRELGTMAYQPRNRGALEVIRPWLFLEVLDDAGRLVAPGETGHLVWTSTVGRGTPFVRYDIGDLGTYDPDDHDESGITRIAELHGRTAGMIRLPDGRTLHGLYWNHLMKEYSEVEQFQVAWIAESRLELRLRGRGGAPERNEELRRLAQNFAGPSIPVEIRWVDRIPLTAQGKLMQVVREDELTAARYSGSPLV